MSCSWTPKRRVVLSAIWLCSALTGLGLMSTLLTPQRVALLRTPELLGMVGLVLLPGVWTWSLRRSRSTRGTPAAAPGPAAETAPPAVAASLDLPTSRRVVSVVLPSTPLAPATAKVVRSRDDWQIVIPVDHLRKPGARPAPSARRAPSRRRDPAAARTQAPIIARPRRSASGVQAA